MVAMFAKLKQNWLVSALHATWHFYTYFFYRIYVWNLQHWDDDIAEYKAMLSVAFMLFVNILTLASFIAVLVNAPAILHARSYEIAAIVLVIAVVSYCTLVHKKRYEMIAKEFSNEQSLVRKKRTVLCWLYVIMSFAALFLVAHYMSVPLARSAR